MRLVLKRYRVMDGPRLPSSLQRGAKPPVKTRDPQRLHQQARPARRNPVPSADTAILACGPVVFTRKAHFELARTGLYTSPIFPAQGHLSVDCPGNLEALTYRYLRRVLEGYGLAAGGDVDVGAECIRVPDNPSHDWLTAGDVRSASLGLARVPGQSGCVRPATCRPGYGRPSFFRLAGLTLSPWLATFPRSVTSGSFWSSSSILMACPSSRLSAMPIPRPCSG